MKKPLSPTTVAIVACLGLATSMAFAQTPARKAFGKGNPFTVEELPAGKLQSQLPKLSPQARDKAIKWLHTFDFSAFDAAEHLRVDDGGGIFIVCPDSHGNCEGHSHGPAAPEATNDSPTATGNTTEAPADTTEPPVAYAAVPVPVGSPPAYNSKPGATRHIYLDFNGGIVSGTAWSTTAYDVKVWSQDTDRTTFNDAEQTWMRRIYERVAEDYAPFDVNVTTDTAYDPDNYTGNKDFVGWLMICETTDNSEVQLPHFGYGGIAYVGVFGNSTYSPTYQPAWVTSTNGGGNEAIVAEAASHEMGHNMGLSHDGTSTQAYYGGHVATTSAPSWGPIMGTGYNQNVSQWSKGEYYNANQLQDDLSIMSGRIPYRTDDHGDNFAGATAVVATNNAISQKGIVETTNDPDVFSFTTGMGAISFTANPYRCDADTWGGNLDVILELYDSSQTLITSSNPAALATASISTTVAAAGTYYLVLKPSAAGTPLVSPPSGYTVYGSLGQYTISGTVQPFDPPLGLTGISPSSGNAGSTVTVDISGTKLASNTAVKLKKPGRADIAGSSVQMIGNTLRCQFNLTGAASGAWDVVATNPDLATSTLPAAFTVIAVPTTLWSEDFDGSVTGWTSQATLGTHSWEVSTAQSQTPSNSYFASAPAVKITSHLTSPAISIPAASTGLQLKFWHSYGLDSQKDGGRLELSVDDGASWFAIENANSGAAFAQNGYTATIGTANPNNRSEFNDLSAWTGASSGFVETIVNLTSANFANKSFRARWIIATDASTASTGWYVDSISLIGTSGGPPPNQLPVITVAASTSSGETQTDGPTTYQIIRGASTSLSVTATDDAGEPDLTYTWQSTGPAPVVFPVNGNNAAKNTTATFSTVGDYLFTVTAMDTGDLSTTSTVNVRVLPTDSLVITPSSGSLAVGNTLQFSAEARDQFGTLLPSQPSPINWSTSGGGSIDSTGLFTATTPGGPFTITATSGASYSATAQVTVTFVLDLTWDANGGAANQTDGAGAWLGANQWWSGSGNVTWTSGSDALFGKGGSGGAVSLASPTTANIIAFNAFSGNYTLGTAGQALTINGGITMNTGSGPVSIISPVTLGGEQTWANNSSGLLTVGSGAVNNGGFSLTANGTGNTTLSSVISGGGGLTKSGTGALILSAAQDANNYTGNTKVTGGILQLGTVFSNANNIPGGLTGTTGTGASNLELDGGTATIWYYMTRTLGAGSGQIQITGGRSGFTNKQTDAVAKNWRVGDNAANEIVWGSTYFSPTTLVLQDAAASPNTATFTLDNKIDLNGATRTIEVGASTATLSQIIRNTSGIVAGLTKTGGGTLILSAANTYNGTTTISAGILQIGNATAGSLGNGTYNGDISMASGTTLRIFSTAAQTLGGAISGGGNLVKAYAGNLTVSNSNTYTGKTSISPQTTEGAGTVSVSSFNSVNGGTPMLESSSLGAPITVANGTIDFGSAGIQGGAVLKYTGLGETTDRVIHFLFNGTGATKTLDASGASGLLKFTSTFTGSGSTTNDVTLQGSSNGEIVGGLPLVFRNFSKSGNGTWTLGGTGLYTGSTTITAGKLAFGANHVLPDASALSIANATLDAATFTDAVGTLDITSTASINFGTGATLAFADSSAIDWTGGTLNLTGTFVSGASLRFGTTNTGLTSAQLAKISAAGFGSLLLDANGYLTADITPPTLAGSNIVDDKSGAPITVNTLVTYTVTFSEDMNAGTVTPAVFGNAGSAAVTIGSVAETLPGVFTVQATPTSAGTLQLKINAAAILKDVAGNNLDTASALPDETVITVNTAFDSWASATFSNGTLSDTNMALDFDGGGLATGIEWVVGSDPTTGNDDAAKAPACDITTDPSYLTYTYRRSDAANTDSKTAILVEYGNDLSRWTTAVAGPDVVITESDNFYGTSPGIDKVEVKIKRSFAGDRLFTRLNVVITP
jgi:autotransporter-associated beta strand protein